MARRLGLALPEARSGPSTDCQTSLSWYADVTLQCQLAQLGTVSVEQVGADNRVQRRLMMRTHHPCGDPLLPGRQLRYWLVSSEHGRLGGLSFHAASVLCLLAVTWTPSIGVPVTRQPADSSRARPQGVRRTRKVAAATAVAKSLWVRPLTDGWQQSLCREPQPELANSASLPFWREDAHWTEMEYGNSSCVDRRIGARILQMGRAWEERPGAPVVVPFMKVVL